MLTYHPHPNAHKKLRGSLDIKGVYGRIVWSDDPATYPHMLTLDLHVILVGEIALSLV